jgi:hypothetical protein
MNTAMFYFLKPLLNGKTGAPQITSILPEQNIIDNNSLYAFGRIDFPDLRVDYLILDETAELTDVICAPMLILTGLLVNEKVRNILEQFNLPEYRFYPLKVKTKSHDLTQYFWLQTSSERELNLDKHLNFKMSTFAIERKIREYESVNIASYEEFSKVKSGLNKFQSIKLKEARLNSNFKDFNLDLFKISRLYTYWIISEQLKSKLESENITGVKIEKAEAIKY